MRYPVRPTPVTTTSGGDLLGVDEGDEMNDEEVVRAVEEAERDGGVAVEDPVEDKE